MLTMCGLLASLSGLTAAQDRDAQLAEAERLNEKVETLYNMGRYGEAIPLAERALAIGEKVFGAEHPDIALLLNNLAALYGAIGDYGRAEPLLQRAVTIRAKALGPGHPYVAASLNNLAMLYKDKGDYGQAEPLYRRALAIGKKALDGEYPPDATSLIVASALSGLGELYTAKGNYARAEPLYQRTLVLREKTLGNEHPLIATSLNNLAALYGAIGNYGRAEPLYQRALAISEKALGKEHPDVAASLNNLAMLYRDNGDYRRAEPLLQRALAIGEKVFGAEHPDVARLLNNLALLYEAIGNYSRAEPLYLRALAIGEKVFGREHPDVARLLNNVAVLYEAKGDYVRAVQFKMRTLEVSERNLSLILTSGSEDQKQIYLNSLSGETDGAVSLHIRSAPTDEQAAQLAMTTIIRRKGRALDAMSGQLAALRRRAAPEDQRLLDELAATRSQLARLQLSSAGQLTPEARRAEVARLAVAVERVEGKVSRSSGEFRAQVQSVTLDAVRQVIPANAALVEIFSYQPFKVKVKSKAEMYGVAQYVAYVVRRDEAVPQWVELGEGAAIDAEVERLRAALKDPKRADVQTIARAVDGQVMQPIRKLLGQTRQIFLSPDGALNLIPFAALVDENGKYLAENYSFTYLTSGRDLLRMQAQAESRNAPIVMANPLYDLPADQHANPSSTRSDEHQRSLDFRLLNYKPLPGTAEEAAALGKLWPDAQVLTQDKATESALKQVHSPRILHVATHGFFLADQPRDLPASDRLRRETIDMFESSPLPNPSPLPAGWENPLLRSGLVLAGVKQQQSGAGEDGVLTALETAGLDLWGTKLVVLSACETGLGEVQNGVGVYGLRRALVLAGSQTQVMSLWKVSDAGTRDLMTAYYTRLQAGEGRTEALRQVQLAMLRGELKSTQDGTDYQHPYYWAAFIPSGDWRSMDGKEDGVEPRSLLRSPAVLSLAIIGFIVLLLFWVRRRRA
ncbi:MAG: tetratricopeptide repeat protein [Planctomycetota bacterium]